jgi:hypothetical protein
LFRQGRLQPHGDEGDIDLTAFKEPTGQDPVFETQGAGDKIDRGWYRVANLSADVLAIQAQTTEFVWLCAKARSLRKGVAVPSNVVHDSTTEWPPVEPTGPYVVPPQDERVAQRLHGAVFTALVRGGSGNSDSPMSGFSA